MLCQTCAPYLVVSERKKGQKTRFFCRVNETQTDPEKQMTNKGIKRLRDRNEKQLVMQKKEKI